MGDNLLLSYLQVCSNSSFNILTQCLENTGRGSCYPVATVLINEMEATSSALF